MNFSTGPFKPSQSHPKSRSSRRGLILRRKQILLRAEVQYARISLKGVDCTFWPRFGCLRGKTNSFTHTVIAWWRQRRVNILSACNHNHNSSHLVVVVVVVVVVVMERGGGGRGDQVWAKTLGVQTRENKLNFLTEHPRLFHMGFL